MLATWKNEKDQRALWADIDQGLIDAIGTDHTPNLKKEKLVESPPAGVTGVETMAPLLLDAFNKGRVSLTKIVELTSKNTAKIFGIKNKGMLKVGYDTDLCVIDVNIEKKVRNDKLHTKCGWSPFEGKSLKGWPVCTVVNGNIVFEKGDIFEIKAKGVIYNEL